MEVSRWVESTSIPLSTVPISKFERIGKLAFESIDLVPIVKILEKSAWLIINFILRGQITKEGSSTYY